MVKLPTMKCNRCDYEWIPRVPNPRWCAKCRSPYWNKERKIKIKETN
jgi:predicted Zn-ribbon and HTH transcriptional regulator